MMSDDSNKQYNELVDKLVSQLEDRRWNPPWVVVVGLHRRRTEAVKSLAQQCSVCSKGNQIMLVTRKMKIVRLCQISWKESLVLLGLQKNKSSEAVYSNMVKLEITTYIHFKFLSIWCGKLSAIWTSFRNIYIIVPIFQLLFISVHIFVHSQIKLFYTNINIFFRNLNWTIQ